VNASKALRQAVSLVGLDCQGCLAGLLDCLAGLDCLGCYAGLERWTGIKREQAAHEKKQALVY
jgi:hypothetical protein